MIEEMGTVVATEPGYAWVETKVKTTCGSCVAQDNCGTGLVAKTFSPKPEHVKIAVPDPLKVGQSVKIGIPEQQLLWASMVLYICPLLALIATASIGFHVFTLPEPLVILGSFAMTFATYWLVSRHIKRQSVSFAPIFLGASNEAIITRKHEIPLKKLS
ncbi:SoxR reducing system RseC family protein [Glaciecola sp. XM2]|jgi:sigma-E factor negative regulatory protein RseC|uniref:SoxR reducing system RseC family protein n=1 Tax=Glaciecola sp. XM2 TaxID=1914931 RepID=UPI001BDE78E6|nr:SoxR reducing system RseC family protein [Glaciecola sp. XM2]MBT1452318.1 SoxR reducing system RseC family protein [Glaciecola sp. XM2]